MKISRRVRRLAIAVALATVVLPVAVILVLRFVSPPLTPFMLVRAIGGAPIDYHWIPLRAMSPHVVRAVVAAEDARFMQHSGFDWVEVEAAMRANQRGRTLRGASTISMQCARTLLLWPGRSVARKGIEAYLTVLLEMVWGKRRILEAYLNLVEWGNGIYGCEAAARAYFGISCASVDAAQSARLAAILPSPRRWSAADPNPYVRRRANVILARMAHVEVPER
jgi:monofunctional glycosyltransferase